MNKKLMANKKFKIRNFGYPLYHVGELDITKKSNFSYEGNGLSVSICPSAWESIARISSSTVWKITKRGKKLLDYYETTEDIHNDIVEWGIENGYLEEIFGKYAYRYYSDELDRYLCESYDSFKEIVDAHLVEGFYNSYDEYLNSEEGDDEVIFPVRAFLPTEKLQNESLILVTESNCVDQNFLLYVEKYTDYDGVYWDDRLDILSLSAPRGVIFNSRLDSFNKTLMTKGDYCEPDDIQNQLWDY